MTTPGTPEKVKPSTLYSQVQCRPSWYQMPGIEGDRCGSFARIGLPVVVRLPAMTHELEPTPGVPSPISFGSWLTARSTAANTGPAAAIAALSAPVVAAVVRAGSGGRSTIGRCSSNGYPG